MVDIVVDGKPAAVPASNLQLALDAGAKLASPAEAAATAKPGGLLDTLKAAEIGFGSSLAGGFIPGAIKATAKKIDPDWARAWGENYEAAAKESQADHPVASAVGGLAGMATDLLGPIGRGPAALGEAARVGAGAGKIGRIVGAGIEAAGQQSIYNVGKQFSEDELGDADLNAEKLFAAAANKDTLLAGGIGAGFGAAGVALGAIRPMFTRAGKGPIAGASLDAATGLAGAGGAVASEARQTESFVGELQKLGHTSEQAAGVAADLDAMAKTKGPLTGMFSDAVEPYIKQQAARASDPVAAEALMRRQLSGGAENAIERNARFDTMARELQTHGDDVLRKAVDNVDEVQFATKRAQMEKLVDSENWRGARDAALGVWQDTKALVEKWEDIPAAGAGGAIKNARKWLTELEDANRGIGKIATQADKERVAAEMFSKLDEFKRQIAPAAKFGKSIMGQATIDGASVAGDFDALYHRIRTTLEDEAIWGKAGAAQRENNAAITNFLSKSEAFKSQFGAVELERAAGRPVLETDPGKFKGFLRSLGGAEGDKPRQVLRDYLDAVTQRANAAKAHYEIPAKQLAEMNAGVDAARTMLGKLDGAEKEARELAKLEQSIAGEHATGLGGLMGMTADAYTAPFRTLGRLAQIKRAAEAFDGMLGKSLRGFVDTGAKSTAADVARKAGLPKADAGRDRDAVIAEIQGVKAHGGNPVALIDRMDKAVGKDMQAAAPKHSAALATTAARAATYLASIAPQGRASLSLVPTATDKLRYSDAEIDSYERASDAVHDPERVIRDAGKGTLTREAVGALSAVYPKLYEQMQQQTIALLADMEQRGDLEKIPYQRRILIGTLLQIPADDAMRPEIIRAIQATKAQDAPAPQKPNAPPEKGGGRRPFKLDPQMYRTDSQTIEGGGRAT
jgi:hypothetical protein